MNWLRNNFYRVRRGCKVTPTTYIPAMVSAKSLDAIAPVIRVQISTPPAVVDCADSAWSIDERSAFSDGSEPDDRSPSAAPSEASWEDPIEAFEQIVDAVPIREVPTAWSVEKLKHKVPVTPLVIDASVDSECDLSLDSVDHDDDIKGIHTEFTTRQLSDGSICLRVYTVTLR